MSRRDMNKALRDVEAMTTGYYEAVRTGDNVEMTKMNIKWTWAMRALVEQVAETSGLRAEALMEQISVSHVEI